jgi:hypothetical protein
MFDPAANAGAVESARTDNTALDPTTPQARSGEEFINAPYHDTPLILKRTTHLVLAL